MSQKTYQHIRLDLNNPVFQRLLFNLSKSDQHNTLNTLRKLANMKWQQVYSDYGLKWEVILSQKGPGGNKLYSFRIGKGFRSAALSLCTGSCPKMINPEPPAGSTAS